MAYATAAHLVDAKVVQWAVDLENLKVVPKVEQSVASTAYH